MPTFYKKKRRAHLFTTCPPFIKKKRRAHLLQKKTTCPPFRRKTKGGHVGRRAHLLKGGHVAIFAKGGHVGRRAHLLRFSKRWARRAKKLVSLQRNSSREGGGCLGHSSPGHAGFSSNSHRSAEVCFKNSDLAEKKRAEDSVHENIVKTKVFETFPGVDRRKLCRETFPVLGIPRGTFAALIGTTAALREVTGQPPALAYRSAARG